jgi:hypothetical protein
MLQGVSRTFDEQLTWSLTRRTVCSTWASSLRSCASWTTSVRTGRLLCFPPPSPDRCEALLSASQQDGGIGKKNLEDAHRGAGRWPQRRQRLGYAKRDHHQRGSKVSEAARNPGPIPWVWKRPRVCGEASHSRCFAQGAVVAWFADAQDLIKAGHSCLSLHGGIDQQDRDSNIKDFKDGNIRLLIATSVAARGLDVKHLNLVVNYDCPSHYEDYVHRCGRTGRAGNKVLVFTMH